MGGAEKYNIYIYIYIYIHMLYKGFNKGILSILLPSTPAKLQDSLSCGPRPLAGLRSQSDLPAQFLVMQERTPGRSVASLQGERNTSSACSVALGDGDTVGGQASLSDSEKGPVSNTRHSAASRMDCRMTSCCDGP